MRRYSNMLETKEYDKTSGKQLNRTEFSKLPDKEINGYKMLNRFEKTVDQFSKNFHRDRKYKNQSEIKNTINQVKNTLEGINQQHIGGVEWISDLEDIVMESTQVEQQKVKNYKKK